MDRSNHYEAAFEAYLQWHKLCYVGIDETRRAFLGDRPVKSLDFIVLTESGSRLLIDVKGRRYGGSKDKPRKVWECWSTLEDIDGLGRWIDLFGGDYQGLLVFMHEVDSFADFADGTGEVWTWRGRRYILRAVSLEEYRAHMRTRSQRWATVHLPTRVFRELARPFHDYTVAGGDDFDFPDSPCPASSSASV
jgi:hypothetical protein